MRNLEITVTGSLILMLEFQVGLNTISLDEDPHSLSGGYKRRLALAIQLVRIFFGMLERTGI